MACAEGSRQLIFCLVRPLRVHAFRYIVAAVALVTSCAGAITSVAGGEPDVDPQRVLGCWLGPRKFAVYHPDGTWGVKRHEDAPEDFRGRRWRIEGNTLFLTFAGDRGMTTVDFAIVSLTDRETILEADGYRQTYVRYTEDCQTEA